MAVAGDPFGYYGILGLSPRATMDEIKAAFREQAKLYHPDGGSLADAERFRSVQEAYATLRDPYRRQAYDGSASSSFTLYPTLPRRGRRLAYASIAAAVLLLTVTGGLLIRRSGGGAADPRAGAATLAQAAACRTPAPPLSHAVLAFGGDSYAVDDALRPQLVALRRDLATAMGRLPAGAAWAVVVATRAERPVDAQGVRVESFETSLLRLGSVVDALVRAGVPSERIGLQFTAGGLDGGAAAVVHGGTPARVSVDLVAARPACLRPAEP